MNRPSLEDTLRLVQQAPRVPIYDNEGIPQRTPWQNLINSISRVVQRFRALVPDRGGLRLPSYTTSQRNQISAKPGEVIWNRSLEQVEIWSGSSWDVVWSTADASSVGLSQVTAAAVGLGPGATTTFNLPTPATFFELNALHAEVSNITPGVGISSFDLAFYDTPANAAAGTFSIADAGLQFLAPNLTAAASGPEEERWAVLGLMKGSLVSSASVVVGKVRNNDLVSSLDLDVAIEAYGRSGSRAV